VGPQDPPPDPTPVGDGQSTTQTTTTTETSTETTTVATAETGTAAFCLHVQPDGRVVQCYWTKQACDEQIKFNQGLGVNRVQECKGYTKAYCTSTSGSGESCYPTAQGCEATYENMKKRNRQPTSCAEKTGP
jgi:hypothetical protein